MYRLYRLAALCLLLFAAPPAPAHEPLVDALGEPLPPRALLRLGTGRVGTHGGLIP